MYRDSGWIQCDTRHNSLVGVSLLAIAVCHIHLCRLTLRYREQARSHRGIFVELGM